MSLNTPAPQPGFAPSLVNSTQWNSQVVEASAQAQQQAIAYRAAQPQSSFDWIPDWIKKPVEWTGSKIHSIYSAAISRPLATALLAPQMGYAADNHNPFSPEIWDKAYNDAKHVSPGQALEFGFEHFFDNKDEIRNALMKPVEYRPKDIYGKPAVDEQGKPIVQNLNQTGLLWDNPLAVQEHFDHGIQKWTSGGIDAAVSWYADPLALGGKAVGSLRNIAYVRPASETANRTMLGAAAAKISGGRVGVPQTTNNITKNLQSSAFNAMGDLIMAQKAKLGAVQGPLPMGGASLPGSTFNEWASHQAWAKNSADSGALIAQLGKASDRGEVDQILSVSMGSEEALQTLTARNAELGAMASMLNRQRNGLVSGFPAMPTPAQALTHAQQLEDISNDLSRISMQTGSIESKIDLANTMKSGMYFNPVISPIASNFGQYVRGLETIKRGETSAAAQLAFNNLYVRPLRVITGTTWGAIRAPGHIDIHADDSHRALDASLDQSRVWTPQERAEMVSNYIGLNSGQRGTMLDVTDRATVGRIAQKYGLDDDQAGALYRQLGGMKGAARDGRIYSTARINTPSGGTIRADHVDEAGNVIGVSPILNSQLENTHIMTDFEHFDKVLKYNAGAFKRLFNEAEIKVRASAGGPVTSGQLQQASQEAMQATGGTLAGRAFKVTEVSSDIAELMGRMWKFNVLLRLGYGPRAIADDFMGQAARFGSFTTFGERMVGGGRNYALRNWNKALNDPTGYEQQISSIDSGINILTQRSAKFQAKMDEIQSYLPPAMDYAGRGALGRRQLSQRTSNLAAYQQRMDDTQSTLEALKAQRNKLGETKNALGDDYIIMPDGTAFPRPYEGPSGALFRDLNTGRRTIDTVLGGTASDIWNAYRSNDWRVVTSAEPEKHLPAWLKSVQYQIANDKAAMQVVKGKDAAALERWFGTPEGRIYRRESAVHNISDSDHADRIAAHVNEYLPTHTPEAMAVRQAVADGANDSTVAGLMRKTDLGDRPDVQAAGLDYAMGKGDAVQGIDSAITKFYNVMNQLPAEVLSRNPLFFQLYRQHASELWSGAKEQGVTHLSPARQQQMADQARRLALKDVKKFTFNMDFETKLAHNMRFIAPFFGPMQESFTRWGRIIADRPETLSHAANIYTSPIRAGHAVDQSGNPVDEDGYVHNPDGSKTLIAKSDMHLQFQVPTWAQKGLGLDGGTSVDMPIDTLNLVLQNDPWYNPGTGPWMQVPANYVALRANPNVGDMLKKMGVLQQVKENSLQQLSGSTPKFLAQMLSSDPEQEQKDILQVMQIEDYKFKNGMRSKEPTWQEVKDRAEHGAFMRAMMKTVLPVSSTFKDPYQFFRDRYQELQQANPKTADQVFLAKYGESAFAFTGAYTKSGKGLPATAEAVMADKRFAYLTDAHPELAQLIVGPYGQGDFSQTAYMQQVVSGDRKKLTAKESMDQANANLGWATFGKYMNQISAGLYQDGFTSFQQKGAEIHDQKRKALISMLTSPTMPDGTDNKFYNPQFDQSFNTVDRTKDDRRAAAMRQLVTEGSLIGDPMRHDIQGLSQYLIYRTAMQNVLHARDKAGGSADINARTNGDLKETFHNITMNLVQQNTQFQSLHDRFLTHDMFNHYDPAFNMTGAQ